MLLAPSMIDEASEDLVVRGQSRFRSSIQTQDLLIRELAKAVITDFARPSRPTRRLYFESIGHTLAGHLVRSYTEVPIRELPPRSLGAHQLRQVYEFVDATLDQTVSVGDMAAAAALSTRVFADAFKRTTGMTPYRFVMRRRLQSAKRLL